MSDSILQVNKIKDKGGNATGITIADTSANVTIGNLTATSLAGGTIASAVTFPAGHILQVQYKSNSTQMESTGSYVQLLNGGYITITKIAGTNIFLSWSTQGAKGGGNTYMTASKIERSTATNFSSLTTLPASPDVAATEEPSGSAGYTGEATSNYFGNCGHTTIDEGITSSAGTYYYRVQFKSNNSSTFTAIDAGVSTFYAMEIKS